MESIVQDIHSLRREHNALILAHYYESGDIQDLADAVGDSLYLAQVGQRSPNPIVLLAGVVFMAESVKLLSPEKLVLVPDLSAGCSLVDHSPFEKYQKWRQEHPDAVAVTYINSSAAVKSLSDVICTSSNAERIIQSIPKDRKILFGPDRNLGKYLSGKTGREMLLWPGACEVHVLFSARKLFLLKRDHPDALVLAHPECVDSVLDQADVIGSTSHLLNMVAKAKESKFIVATEAGILHQMQKVRPDGEFYQAPAEGSCACNECPYMKLNTLEKIRSALQTLRPSVDVPQEIAGRARLPLERMMKITAGDTVNWTHEARNAH